MESLFNAVDVRDFTLVKTLLPEATVADLDEALCRAIAEEDDAMIRLLLEDSRAEITLGVLEQTMGYGDRAPNPEIFSLLIQGENKRWEAPQALNQLVGQWESDFEDPESYFEMIDAVEKQWPCTWYAPLDFVAARNEYKLK